MLASITPLGERGRQAHWVVTVTAFMIGAAGAGMLVGAEAHLDVLLMAHSPGRSFRTSLSEETCARAM